MEKNMSHTLNSKDSNENELFGLQTLYNESKNVKEFYTVFLLFLSNIYKIVDVLLSTNESKIFDRLYLANEKKSYPSIALECGVDIKTIYRFRKKSNLFQIALLKKIKCTKYITSLDTIRKLYLYHKKK